MAQGRRAGYVVAAVIDAAMLYAVNRWPGWDALGFLTDRTPEVLGLVNASMLVSLVANLTYLVHDGPRWRATGDLAVTAVGLAALLRIWRVFPFDFGDTRRGLGPGRARPARGGDRGQRDRDRRRVRPAGARQAGQRTGSPASPPTRVSTRIEPSAADSVKPLASARR